MKAKKITFSRHAKRRMKLYNIPEDSVSSIIKRRNPEMEFLGGKHELLDPNTLTPHGYPLKVVFTCEGDEIVVITAYPFKRGYKK